MSTLLDKQSPVPIYSQIEDYLKERILLEEYPIGGAIPSERELTELFGVSRMTIRQSITNLVNEGLLHREKGRGTFVSEPKVEQHLSGLTSFTEDMLARGMKPSSQLVGFILMKPSRDVAQELLLSEEEEVYLVKRIRYADDISMAIEQTYLPAKLFPVLTEDNLHGSLYELIEENAQLAISHATQRMEAALVRKEEAEELQIDIPSAVLIIQRTGYLSNNTPYEYVRSIYRADRYKFTSEIRRGV